MKLGITCAATLLASSLISVPALANQPTEEPTQEVETEEDENTENGNAEGESAAMETPEVKKEPKRICRRVKLDMSSRRATKVCKTSDEWREFNQQR